MVTRWWIVATLLAGPGLAFGQPVASVDRLADRLNAGDHVRVVDSAGRDHTGAVATLTPAEIGLDRGGGAVERLATTDIREVWTRRRDSVRNGALIGFGSVAVSYCGLALSWGNPRQCALPAMFLGGLGAGLGALVDAAFTRRFAVFRAADSVALRFETPREGVALGATVRW